MDDSELKAQSAREKYVTAFNSTMIDIWREQIVLLGVIDTKSLLGSFLNFPVQADGRFYEVSLSLAFLEYGVYQDMGVGRETPRGNSGDIGHDKVRKPRKWFSRKFYRSAMNLKEFFADNLGHEFIGLMTDALNDDWRKK